MVNWRAYPSGLTRSNVTSVDAGLEPVRATSTSRIFWQVTFSCVVTPSRQSATAGPKIDVDTQMTAPSTAADATNPASAARGAGGRPRCPPRVEVTHLIRSRTSHLADAQTTGHHNSTISSGIPMASRSERSARSPQ